MNIEDLRKMKEPLTQFNFELKFKAKDTYLKNLSYYVKSFHHDILYDKVVINFTIPYCKFFFRELHEFCKKYTNKELTIVYIGPRENADSLSHELSEITVEKLEYNLGYMNSDLAELTLALNYAQKIIS